jgi:hypothetical protein
MPMPQQTLELHDAALARFQKFSQFRQQRGECPEKGILVLQLIVQFAAAAKPFASMKALVEIRTAAGEPVEHRK